MPKSESLLPQLVFNTGLTYVGTLSVIGLGFVTKVVLARALSPVELGLLFTGQMIVGLVQNVAQLGLPEAVTRYVGLYANDAMGRAKRVLLDGLLASQVATIVVVAVLISSAPFIAHTLYNQPSLAAVLVWLALSLPFVTLAEILAAGSRGLGQIWVKVLCVDVGRLLWVIVIVGGLVIVGSNALLTVAIAYACASFVTGIVTWITFHRDSRWSIRPASGILVGEMMSYSLPLLGTSFVAWPSTFIPLWLGSLVSPQVVGYFALASALSSIVYLPVNAVDFALLPVLVGRIAQENLTDVARLYTYTTRWCFIIGSVAFVVLFLFPGTVLEILYGPAYVEGALVLQVMALTILAQLITGTNASVARAYGHTHLFFVAVAAQGLTILILGFPMIKYGGVIGGLAIYLLSQYITVGLFAVFLFRKQGVQPFAPIYVRTLLVSGGAVALAAIIQHFISTGLLGAVIVTSSYTALLTAGLFVTRAFDEQDERVARRAWAWIRRDRL